MSSPAQIAASRANGARSRGPTTAQGKRNSSRNSTRHGFSAPDPSLDHDPPAAFIELRAGFMASHRPRNVAEAQLINTMAVAHWRMLQVIKAQTIALDKAIASHLPDSPDPAVRAVLAFETASEFHVLHRYETAFDRQSDRALRRLQSLKSRPAKIFYAERTQQRIESKPAAIEAAVTSKLHECSDQGLSRLPLQSRPEKIFHAERTQQDIESKPAATEAALPNPALCAASRLQEDAGQDSPRKRLGTRRQFRTLHRRPPQRRTIENLFQAESSPLLRRIQSPPHCHRRVKMINKGWSDQKSFLPLAPLKIRRAPTHLR